MSSSRTWQFTDHVCRHCLSRVMISDNGDGSTTVRCSNCEAEAQGDHMALCACGVKLKSGKSAGLRCIKNPKPSADMPAKIVATAL